MLNDVLYPKVFWDAIAQELNMLDGARSYFNKLINAKTPGWEFMKCYNWAYLLYKVQKEV
jgi:hypothetical protein